MHLSDKGFLSCRACKYFSFYISKTRNFLNMAPSATSPYVSQDSSNPDDFKSRNDGPLKKNGALDAAFPFEDSTPVIGREYPTANIVDDLLNAPNSDELLRDLAITSKQFCISETMFGKTKSHDSQSTWCGLLPQARQPLE